MEKLLYILFLISNISFSQSLNNLDTLSGFDKYKFGTSPIKYKDLKANEFQDFYPSSVLYNYIGDTNYQIKDVNLKIKEISFVNNKRLNLINLHSQKETSLESLNNDFEKIKNHFENIYGKDWRKWNNKDAIQEDSLYSKGISWKWKNKRITITQKYYIQKANNQREGWINVFFEDKGYFDKASIHPSVANKNEKISNDLDLLEGYKQFKFGVNQSEFEKTEKNQFDKDTYNYTNNLEDFHNLRIQNIALSFNNQKYGNPLYKIELTSEFYTEYNQVNAAYQKLAQYFKNRYNNYKSFVKEDQNPTYSRILKSITFSGKRKLFSINMDYSEELKRYTIFIDFIDYSYSNYNKMN